MGDGGMGHGRAGRRSPLRVGERAGGRGRRVFLAAGGGAPGAHGVSGMRAYRAGGVHGVGASRGQVGGVWGAAAGSDGWGFRGWGGGVVWPAVLVVLLLMLMLLT